MEKLITKKILKELEYLEITVKHTTPQSKFMYNNITIDEPINDESIAAAIDSLMTWSYQIEDLFTGEVEVEGQGIIEFKVVDDTSDDYSDTDGPKTYRIYYNVFPNTVNNIPSKKANYWFLSRNKINHK